MALGGERIFFASCHTVHFNHVHESGLFIGGKEFSSIHMIKRYIQMVQDGKYALAERFRLNSRLRYSAGEIPLWVRDHGYQPSATAVFRANEIISDIWKYQFRSGGPLREGYRFLTRNLDLEEYFELISCGYDYVYDCGLRYNTAVYDLGDLPDIDYPGFNNYGTILSRLSTAFLGIESPPSFGALKLIREPVIPALTYPKTVLAVTDSFGRPIGEIEGGDIYAYSGATFRKLMNTLHPMNINFCDYRFVIIHCGINDIQRGRQWAERSFTEMLSYLRSVQIERNGFPAGNILISCPLLHPRIPQAADYSNFIQTAAEPHGLTVLNWAQGSTNPFVEDLEWRDRTSASDQFHVNHAGTRSLWKAWCDKFPSMRVVSYRLEKERVPAHPPANAGASAGPVAGPSWQ